MAEKHQPVFPPALPKQTNFRKPDNHWTLSSLRLICMKSITTVWSQLHLHLLRQRNRLDICFWLISGPAADPVARPNTKSRPVFHTSGWTWSRAAHVLDFYPSKHYLLAGLKLGCWTMIHRRAVNEPQMWRKWRNCNLIWVSSCIYKPPFSATLSRRGSE